jgi:hypothetical protein
VYYKTIPRLKQSGIQLQLALFINSGIPDKKIRQGNTMQRYWHEDTYTGCLAEIKQVRKIGVGVVEEDRKGMEQTKYSVVSQRIYMAIKK